MYLYGLDLRSFEDLSPQAHGHGRLFTGRQDGYNVIYWHHFHMLCMVIHSRCYVIDIMYIPFLWSLFKIIDFFNGTYNKADFNILYISLLNLTVKPWHLHEIIYFHFGFCVCVCMSVCQSVKQMLIKLLRGFWCGLCYQLISTLAWTILKLVNLGQNSRSIWLIKLRNMTRIQKFTNSNKHIFISLNLVHVFGCTNIFITKYIYIIK